MLTIVVCLTSFTAAALTLFSGFGLGTLLTPVLSLFFPVEIAVSLTAVVHLLNNIFKFVLLGKNLDKRVTIRFGIPALISSFLGASLLAILAKSDWILFRWQWANWQREVSLLKFVVGIFLSVFAVLELSRKFQALKVSSRYLPIGGVLSGFFGGLTGNQGALRSLFLLKVGLSKESFVATGIAIACMVDIARLFVYSNHLQMVALDEHQGIIFYATASAFIGVYLGGKILVKATIEWIQNAVAFMLLAISLGLTFGIL